MKKMILMILVLGAQSACGMDVPATGPATDRTIDMSAPINLFAAIQQGDAAAVRRVLADGASPNTIAGLSGYTVLMQAAESGSAEIVQALVAAQAHVNVRRRGRTVLDMAIVKGHWDVVKVLQTANADVHRIGLAALAELPPSDDESVQEKIAGTKEL